MLIPIFMFILDHIPDLSIHRNSSADNPKQDKKNEKNSPGPQPSIQIEAHEKTEHDGADHGQADLHYQGGIFRPCPVFAIIEKIFLFVGQGGPSPVGFGSAEAPPAAICPLIQRPDEREPYSFRFIFNQTITTKTSA
jgi:hypothetical protein